MFYQSLFSNSNYISIWEKKKEKERKKESKRERIINEKLLLLVPVSLSAGSKFAYNFSANEYNPPCWFQTIRIWKKKNWTEWITKEEEEEEEEKVE